MRGQVNTMFWIELIIVLVVFAFLAYFLSQGQVQARSAEEKIRGEAVGETYADASFEKYIEYRPISVGEKT